MILKLVGLRELDPSLASVFGGKACGLASLMAKGARVPPGFAVEATTLSPEEWCDEDRHELLTRAGEMLAEGSVAVRSSALGEDSANKSFAGLFETVLGVESVEGIFEAAATCIRSGSAARVLAYAGSELPLPVGVVVQSLVRARAAGVCFTVDPSGEDTAIVLEAVSGSGDKLVAGRGDPERWRAYRSGLGGWECRRDPRSPSEDVLTAAEAERIASDASDLAFQFGRALDLEWAIDEDGTLFWLQARPITAAAAPPEIVIERSCPDGVDDGPVSVWSNWNVRETMPDPMHPLTWTWWREIVMPMLAEQLFGFPRSSRLSRELSGLDLVNGRIYMNMSAILAIPIIGPLAGSRLDVMDARAGPTLARLRREGVLQPRRVRSRWRALPRMAMAAVASLARLSRALGPRKAIEELERVGLAVAHRGDLRALTDEGLLEEMRLWIRPECRRLRDGLQMEFLAAIIYFIAIRAFRRHPRAAQLLAAGIPANPTTQISIAIDELAEAARPLAVSFAAPTSTGEILSKLETVDSGREWLGRLRGFLDLYGHRGPMEFDLGATRWAEDPTMIVELVRAALRSSRETVTERIRRLAEDRRRAVDEAVAESPLWKRPLLRALARLVALYMPLREAPKHYGVIVFQRTRQAALELGGRMAAAGRIDAAADVFFLEWGELEAHTRGDQFQDLRLRVRERQDRHRRFLAAPAPDFVRSDGVPVTEAAVGGDDETADALRGAPISAGRASGPVRVLRQPDPRLFSDGDVLVMEFADPGWTPLFPRASAVVMEVGGLMCHAAVVAREMGIPAVFGVRNATRILTDGQLVEVDGGAGRVTIVGSAPE